MTTTASGASRATAAATRFVSARNRPPGSVGPAGGSSVANGECDIATKPTSSLIDILAPLRHELPRSCRVLAQQQELAVHAQVLVALLPLRPVPGVLDDVQASVGQPLQQQVRLVEAAG